ncbi:MAG: MBL fold metallo-hydrolase [Bacteroidetes bacterium]|nr:MBL fold metallo-hydrolase [Cryomorphaceae bacterium]MBL6677394.1 MBL fold metallo-hydrolase [Flavobacteriaceae bacterium]MDA0331241.1 MBL fold metallo-hydrolase [Bacteroidota bacterium]MDA0885161.1 MBL fold metallo-hydrolase [Bacteroidota bacterium]MDA1225260.1 MBL fold metallo-hydrolase [Bacteroidota bacterium]
MKIEQIYTGCLAQGAYYIESENEVAIIDPLREVNQYIDKAKESNSTIKYIFETHFHADFVSGHITLSKKTGGKIVYGPTAETNFDSIKARDGEVFKIGKITITAIHTPGHTLESTCYLLRNENNKEIAIFTGDTLFLGDVGRPDLAQANLKLTKEQLAGKLYDSLRTKIMSLPDNITVYPAHGAGSACGKNMMKITSDTLANQKKMNYALNENLSKEEFINAVLDGLGEPPKYFPANVKMNKEGYNDINNILQKNRPLKPDEVEQIVNTSETIILDVRTPDDFEKAHIPRSIFIGLDGSFAPWVGELIANVDQKIIFICDTGREEETIIRLSRVGFDNTIGYLDGGIASWINSGREIDSVTSIDPEKTSQINTENDQIIDVRKKSEFDMGRVEKASNICLSTINNHHDKFLTDNHKYIHCQGGYRSMIACSILKSRGVHNITNIRGGFKQIMNYTNIII